VQAWLALGAEHFRGWGWIWMLGAHLGVKRDPGDQNSSPGYRVGLDSSFLELKFKVPFS
jgi:hypothetical protein